MNEDAYEDAERMQTNIQVHDADSKHARVEKEYLRSHVIICLG